MANLSKEELRNLMRKAQAERQQTTTETSRRIVHPLAKYSRTGELMCTACNKRLRNDSLWKSHILSAEHRQSIAPRQPEKRKTETSSSSADELSASKSARTDITATGSRGNDRVNASKVQRVETSSAAQNSALPAGFFDDAPQTAAAFTEDVDEESEQVQDSNNSTVGANNSNEQLPSDFFDTQKRADEQRRLDRELETFQREIAGVIDQGEKNLDADDEQVYTERELLEVDEMLTKWSRVNELEKRVDSTKSGRRQASTSKSDEDSESEESQSSDSGSHSEQGDGDGAADGEEDYLDEQEALNRAFAWRSKR